MQCSPIDSLKRFLLAQPFLFGCAVQGQNHFTTPYAADADALHLWQLNESAVPAADAGSNPWPLQGLLNGATLGNGSAPGFGTALNTDTGVAGAFGILALKPFLATDATDNAPANFTWFGADGAFTLEALVKLDVLPVTAPGGSLDIITMEGDSNERIFNFRIEKSATPALNFLVLPNSGVNPSTTSHQAAIPLTGPHALATNVWFHVAVTYNGNAGAGNNLALYWTRLDAGTTAANLIGSNSLPADFTLINGDFALGNDARAGNGENEVFPGLLDEVRISRVARTPTDFVFHEVTLAGASGSDGNLPENTLDGNFATRWSASGDGQWIAYDLGVTQIVSGVSIAFYNGNTRTTSFDVLVSADNMNWTPVLTNRVSSGTTTNLEWFGFANSTSARYVRIVGHGNSVSAWNSLTEVVIGLANGGDTDHDGLPDSWEQFYFGSLAQTATGDPDGDGLGNLHEFLNGLLPTLVANPGDTDGDGLPDAWEMQHFGDLTQTASGDYDRDGVGNLQEYQAGSSPANPNSIAGDINGNNLPDSWEMAAFGNMTHWAYDDFDGDGYNNTAEMVADTSPTNPAEHPDWTAPRVALLNNTVVTNNACLMPTGSTYGRNINCGSFQADMLITFNGYQYTAWYDNNGSTTSTQTVWLARRTIDKTSVGAWQAVTTGSTFVNGKASWDAHNVISLGISPVDGTLHMAWDHHVHALRYRRSVPGLCTTNTAAWGASMMNAERNWLVASGQTQTGVTYPCFFNSPTGDLVFEYRNGGSGGGDTGLQYYNPATGNWNARWQFVTRNGTFFGISNTTGTNVTSTGRNAYDNGFDFAPDGTLHYTWTFREKNGAFNHDIDYAYSTNGGVTWQNNGGATIADKNTSSQISVTSPGIIMKVMDGTQAMINQQAQCVDGDGRVHVLMSHRRPEPSFEWQPGDSAFGGAERAYYHYFRDPFTHVWSQRRLPTTYAVGSRPKVGWDLRGNIYTVFNSGGRLVVASASKASSYTDWAIAAMVNNSFSGEPLLDQNRLTADDILSVFLQENGPSSTTPIGTPLHVVDFAVDVPPSNPVALSFIGTDALVTVSSQTGYTYQLQTTAELELANWQNVGVSVAGNGGLIALPHEDGAQDDKRFFRVIIRTP